MKISMLRFILQSHLTELLKKKLCYLALVNAQVKAEGSGVSFDEAQETFTARYSHETVALAFAITEEAIEDNLYDRLASRYTKALARSMSNAKQVKAVEPLIQGLPSTDNFDSGDGVSYLIHHTLQWLVLSKTRLQLKLTLTKLH